jgi:hypothetical protein
MREMKSSTVSFAAMSYTINNDSMRSIINRVQNAIVAYTKAVSLGPLQFLNTGRTRIHLKTNNFGGDASMNLARGSDSISFSAERLISTV